MSEWKTKPTKHPEMRERSKWSEKKSRFGNSFYRNMISLKTHKENRSHYLKRRKLFGTEKLLVWTLERRSRENEKTEKSDLVEMRGNHEEEETNLLETKNGKEGLETETNQTTARRSRRSSEKRRRRWVRRRKCRYFFYLQNCPAWGDVVFLKGGSWPGYGSFNRNLCFIFFSFFWVSLFS